MLSWIGAIFLTLLFLGFFRCDCKKEDRRNSKSRQWDE